MSHRGRFIAVGGPIGVGKTTLARILTDELDARFTPEIFRENPFLERLYQPGGTERWGLACEVSFLAPRFDQAAEIERRLAAGEDVVTDWVMEQNLIFSAITLSEEEFRAYRGVFERLMRDAPTPDVLVHLDAPAEELMERVRKRGRDAEYGIELGYLAKIREQFLTWRSDPPDAEEVAYIQTADLPIPYDDRARMEALSIVYSALGLTPVTAGVPTGRDAVVAEYPFDAAF